MKNLTIIIAIIFVSLLSSCKKGDEPMPSNTNNDMITLCHTNNDGTKTTLTVPKDSVNNHLKHGDTFGVCSPF